jgi:hypothetical protein
MIEQTDFFDVDIRWKNRALFVSVDVQAHGALPCQPWRRNSSNGQSK